MKLENQNKEIDEILKRVLYTNQKPDDALHQKVLDHWKENDSMKRKKHKFRLAAAAAICIVALCSISAGAAIHFLTSREAVSEMGYTEIGELFESENAVLLNTSQEAGNYIFTLLGLTEGKALLDSELADTSMNENEFYAVTTVSKTDGSPLTFDEWKNKNSFFIFPLIQGLKPWQYNIASMNGFHCEKEINGIIYRMISCNAISFFADRDLYLCVLDQDTYSIDAYNYDTETEKITPNRDYEGINLLFDLPIDARYADSKKADAIQKELENEENDSFSSPSDSVTFSSGIKNPETAADMEAFMNAIYRDPKHVEDALSNLELIDEQRIPEKDGSYTIEREYDDGYQVNRIFSEDSFENGLSYHRGYGWSDNESYLNIELIRLNPDGTATWKLYRKIYKDK